MKIAIGNDHSAVELKNIIAEHLKEKDMRFSIWEQIRQKAAIIRFTAKRWAGRWPPARRI